MFLNVSSETWFGKSEPLPVPVCYLNIFSLSDWVTFCLLHELVVVAQVKILEYLTSFRKVDSHNYRAEFATVFSANKCEDCNIVIIYYIVLHRQTTICESGYAVLGIILDIARRWDRGFEFHSRHYC